MGSEKAIIEGPSDARSAEKSQVKRQRGVEEFNAFTGKTVFTAEYGQWLCDL